MNLNLWYAHYVETANRVRNMRIELDRLEAELVRAKHEIGAAIEGHTVFEVDRPADGVAGRP